jgi:pyridinium-3,5-biscarboxylic acid mononucleotide synthase
MDARSLNALLRGVKSGKVSLGDAQKQLTDLPFVDLGFANVDTHRALRTGFPEVVLAQWKSTEQVVGIISALAKRGHSALVTRAQPDKGQALLQHFPKGEWFEEAGIFRLQGRLKPRAGRVAVVCAGTSDLRVAEEAALTAESFGATVVRIRDVGVAGIHRLLKRRHEMDGAHAVVAVAGMEGALASALGGLVGVPVVAVPTSVGYGTSFEGITALLSMLNSCASNVAVMNIDNGFGGGFYAAMISRTKGRR